MSSTKPETSLYAENIVKNIAQFIVNTNADSISESAITTAKRAMLDSLGVTLAGNETETGVKLHHFAGSFLGKGEVNVLGSDEKLSCADAAFITGSIMHVLDYDDTGAFSQGHPSASVFPIIFSLSQVISVKGIDAIAAYSVGVEVLSRFSRAMPMMHLKGWHPTGVIGSFAATATASRLLHLTEKQVIHAFGIAASQASGIVQNFGTMSKPLQAGNAARIGIISALLAKEGFTASECALDGDIGFFNTYFGPNHHLNEWFKDFSSKLVIECPGINIKRHASCALTHRSIDGVLQLQEMYGFDIENVESVQCFVPPRAMKVLFYRDPTDGLQARFSMNYVITAALMYKKVGPSEFEDKQLKKITNNSLLYQVRMHVHPDWKEGDDARPDVLKIKLKNATEYELSVKFPKGNVANPLSWEELTNKFLGCVKNCLTKVQAEECILFIEDMQSQNDFSKLSKITMK
jgi:2-methylcitrate dehydratase PrpD